jgi:hypothetical protein
VAAAAVTVVAAAAVTIVAAVKERGGLVTTTESYVSIEEALSYIQAQRGKFIAVVFIKRTTGQERKMVFRTGVRKHLKGGTVPYDMQQRDLLPVFDIQLKEYRCIPLDGIVRIKVNGKWKGVNQ